VTPPPSEPAPLAGARWLKAEPTRRVLAALGAGGREARFVGGCVRDTLLDPTVDPADLDLATQEPPERVMTLLAAAGIRAVPTGLDHGTVTARLGRRVFEITTLRQDVACFGRHAEVAFTTDFVADAARRDFTINAMSCDGAGRLFDPFGGAADLPAGRIRFVGEPGQRIREDYLRILRFFRFYARFGRPPVDTAALAACAAAASGLDQLSGERLRGELMRLLEARGAFAALELMAQAGVRQRLLPVEPDLATLERLSALAPESDALLRLAGILRGRIDAARLIELAQRLRLSRRAQRRLEALVLGPLPDPAAPAPAQRAYLYEHGSELWRDGLRLALAIGGVRARTRLDQLETAHGGFTAPPFPLDGRDLIARAVPAGPARGQVLEQVRRWWIASDFSADRAACLARLDAELARASP
jgi:poly(A) polymerase